ncbi:S8 family serine peptidase [Rossellomorea sp. y25]|uniref:S8 family serine peptidase n=1 Tax=Rossellomorea sp. y25 TaxID=3118174 RepID=UPI0030E1CC96
MKIKLTKSLTTLTLGTGLLLNPVAQTPLDQVAAASTASPIDQVLAKLTPGQRQALNQLKVNNLEGLQLSPETNLESKEEISVIVEFKDKPAETAVVEAAANGKKLSLDEAKQKAEAAHKTFKSDLQKIYKNETKKKKEVYKVKRSYKNAFNGVAIELPANKVKALLESNQVKAVWSNDEVHVEPPVQQGESSNENNETGMRTFPGVEKLHAEGLTGEGIKVGVLDTGVDYKHPDLKDAYKGGYDFVDNDNDPMETTYEDWKNSGYGERNPLTGAYYYTHHGSHVSGIIAGTGDNSVDHAVTGVAPDADLYVYRVLGPYGSGYTEDVLAGIDQAVADDLDVINLSLGASYNNPMYATSIAVNNAVLAGVTAVVSAGNSGSGLYTLGSPGTAPLAITVGASDTSENVVTAKGTLHADTTLPADLKLLGKGYEDNLEELRGQSIPVIDVSLGYESHYNNKNVEGKIVLIQRGITSFVDKITIAYKKGAKAVLLYNNIPEEGFIPTYLGEGYQFVPTFNLSYEQGNELKKKVSAGEATFSFNEMGQETTEGNKLADFSSRGPARTTYDIKPEVTAPGVSVFSTIPSYMHGEDQIGKYEYAYDRLSGTSMASPNAAGVAALLIQSNPELSPSEVKQILMNTADPLNGDYSVYEVGSGVVDPYEAVHSNTRIEVLGKTLHPVDGKEKSIDNNTGAISFGTFAPNGKHLTEDRSLVLYNNSKESKTFDVTVQFQKDRRSSKDASENGVNLTTNSTIKVNGNAKKKTSVFMTIPKTAELGTYEGYIVYTNRNNPDESYQVPFAIQTVEEGINYYNLSHEAMTFPYNYFDVSMTRFIDATFNLKSHMKTLDLFLVDGKTNKEIGFIGSVDGFASSLTNGDLTLKNAFDGIYYPLTGSPDKPLAHHPERAEPGFYKVKVVATNDEGKTFSETDTLSIDYNAPKLSLKPESGVYEYKPEETTVKITGSIFDKEIGEMKEAGVDVTQGDNKVVYRDYLNFRNRGELPVNEDGTFSVDIPMDETRPMHLDFTGIDPATNRTYVESSDIYFIREGEPYALVQPDRRAAFMGETLDVALSLNNVENVKEAVYTFNYNNYYVDIAEVKPASGMSDKISVKVENDNSSPYSSQLEVTATLKEGQQPLSGDLPLVNVTYKVKDEWYGGTLSPSSLRTSITDAEGNTQDMLFNAAPHFRMKPEARVEGTIKTEAFMNPYNGDPATNIDYSTLSAEAKMTGVDGTVYEGTIENGPGFDFNLPLTVIDEQLNLELNVPGHFTFHKTFKMGSYGYKDILFTTLEAGDVNKDDVIDVMDAVYIQEKWGTSDRNADINFDGTVDAADIGYVKENYLMKNPTAENAPKAKQNYKGKSLERILEELGVQ